MAERVQRAFRAPRGVAELQASLDDPSLGMLAPPHAELGIVGREIAHKGGVGRHQALRVIPAGVVAEFSVNTMAVVEPSSFLTVIVVELIDFSVSDWRIM